MAKLLIATLLILAPPADGQVMELEIESNPVSGVADSCAGHPPGTCRLVCEDAPWRGPNDWTCSEMVKLGDAVQLTKGLDDGVEAKAACCAFGGGRPRAIFTSPEVSPAPDTVAWAEAWLPEACRAFAVPDKDFPSIAQLVRSGKDATLGGTGGHWSACTHLHIYGVNFAVFLVRALAFDLRPRSVLEFGCGLGTTSDFLARFTPGGARVVCVEPEPMLKEVFARRPPPQRPMQLAVDVFADAGRPCAAQLFKPRFDLVLTFEVLEHILPARQQAAMDYLAGSTSKYLVFAAARPNQGGTGHIEESMHTREWYVDQFTARGLVYLPGITKGLRAAVRPEREYDLYTNTIVMGRAPLGVDRTDVGGAIAGTDCDLFASPSCRHPLTSLRGSHDALATMKDTKYLRKAWVAGQVQALWPEVDLLIRKLKRGKLRCV